MEKKDETKPKIYLVKDNYDKQETYKALVQRRNRAKKQEFYFEMLLIDYAILEDRMTALLYYLGVISDRNIKSKRYTVPAETRRQLKEIVDTYQPKFQKQISQISTKRQFVRAIALWYQDTRMKTESDAYLIALKKACERLDIDGLIHNLKEQEYWCDYRNEIIHHLMNRKIDGIFMELDDRAGQGDELFRFIDNQTRKVKRVKIRETMKLPTEN